MPREIRPLRSHGLIPSVTTAVLLLFLLSGCESVRRLAIAPAGEATRLGPRTLAAEQNHRVEVELRSDTFSADLGELPTFALTVHNHGPTPLEFGPGHVRVMSHGRTIPLYSRDELTAAIELAARREAEAYTGQQAEVFLQADASRVDPSSALANIEAAKRTNRAGKGRTHHNQQLAEAAQLLIPTTVAAGASITRLVKLHSQDIEAKTPLLLRISVDGEVHEFTFTVSEG